MKLDEVYPYYVVYLDSRLLDNKIGKGAYKLLKMSNSAFIDYKYRFENDELFNERQLELYKSESRDKKIDDIFDGIS